MVGRTSKSASCCDLDVTEKCSGKCIEFVWDKDGKDGDFKICGHFEVYVHALDKDEDEQ